MVTRSESSSKIRNLFGKEITSHQTMITVKLEDIHALHKVDAPAVRTAIKTYLSCRDDTIIVKFCAGNKNKTMLMLFRPLLIVNLRILGLI